MEYIKVKTSAKHRFNRSIRISNKEFQVNSEGIMEITDDCVVGALNVGFELVDKNQKFTSEEQQSHIQEVSDILESAKQQAAEIISQAQKQAAEIISQAQDRADYINKREKVDEKEEYKNQLLAHPVDKVREIMLSTNLFTEEDFKGEDGKNLSKEKLVDKMLKAAFEGSVE